MTATPVEISTAAPVAAGARRFASLRALFALYLPLAVSFELMMLEGPAFQGAIGRLPDPPLHLAAWGLTMSLSLLIESPVILLLATAIALVKDADSFRALRLFTVRLALGCTILTGLVAFTPLFDLLAGGAMGQPAAIVARARPAMQIMLFWTAAIAWRRFYQGVLVRNGQTRFVTWGTLLRLMAAVITATLLARAGTVPGVQVAAWAMMAAVLTEAVATTLFARPIIRRDVLSIVSPNNGAAPPLTQHAIWRFHAPLAATTLLTLLAQPLTSAALARLPDPRATLAAWPVVYMMLLVLRGGGLALQEITVARAKTDTPPATLRDFALLVGGVTSLLTAGIAFTPLLDVYLFRVLDLPAALGPLVRTGMADGLLLPFVTALASHARGLLVAAGATKVVYQAMGVSLGVQVALLTAGVILRLPGMAVAAGAFTLAAIVEWRTWRAPRRPRSRRKLRVNRVTGGRGCLRQGGVAENICRITSSASISSIVTSATGRSDSIRPAVFAL
jgi:hypothetical protein